MALQPEREMVEQANSFSVDDWQQITKKWDPSWGFILNESRKSIEANPQMREFIIKKFQSQIPVDDADRVEIQKWLNLMSMEPESMDKAIIGLRRNFPDYDFGVGS